MDKRENHGLSTANPNIDDGSHETPSTSRSRHRLPEPFCSPIAHRDPFPHGSPISEAGMTPLTHPSPSPATKRFMGVSSNARNDIYMKTLMNSPYHKSYTPMSATPCGPAYQTPVRSRLDNCESPIKKAGATPDGSNPTFSAKKFITPKNMAMNPFDCGVDDLHLPAYMSPGFFTVASTPASEKKSFRWSIEHIAELNPADIDEMPHQEAQPVMPDKETEERAQRAIEQFFANNLIAPSPWSDPKKKNKKKNILPATPAYQGSGSKHAEEMMTELQGSIQKSLPPKQGMEDASCQTMLSLPVNFDLQNVLGNYMMKEDVEEGNQQEMLSTSSLRRKLFFHGDTSSLAPSPVKGVTQTSPTEMEPMSPMFAKQRTPNWDHTTPLKNTPAFSSSPIRSAGTQKYRRCSSDPEFLASPELSPIVHSNIPKLSRKSRSSGMFEPHRASFNISPVSDGEGQSRGCHSPVSPIPFQGMSPEENAEFCPKFADSPGFSPIRPPKTPIRKMLRKSQEESYLQDECSCSDEESITPVSNNPRLESHSLTPVECLSPIHKTPKQRNASSTVKSHSCTDLKHSAMDFESAGSPHRGRYTNNIMTSSLCDTHDFSSSDVDFHDETHLRTSSSNQDTGYQTASLQSTNPESVSQHTNLTNQFSSLPFNLTSQDQAFQNTSHQLASQERPPILNLTQQFSSMADDDFSDQSRTNVSINKQLFPKQNLLSKKLCFMEDENSDSENTPKSVIPSRIHFNDSALPDESVACNDSSVRKMEIDYKKTETKFASNHEEAVLTRARQALAMANNLYPQEGKVGLHDTPASYMDPMSASTPGKVKQLRNHPAEMHLSEKQQSASEVAYSIIQRAGKDLAKYDSILSYKTTELAPDGGHAKR